MSLFDEIEFEDDILSYEEEHLLFVGDLVLYEIPTDRFYIASYSAFAYSPSIALDNKDNQIVMGVSLTEADLKDEIVYSDVLMMNFLLAEPLKLPFMYYGKDKRPYIQAYVKNQFKIYVNKFRKECPDYEKIKTLKIYMPRIDDLKKFKHNKDSYSCISDYLGNEPVDKFRERLEKSKVYALDKNNNLCRFIMNSECPEEKEVEELDYDTCEFLCVFRDVVVRKQGDLY